MNELDDRTLNKSGFAFRDIVGQDKWESWTPVYLFTTATSLTVVGRYRVIGRQCFFQVQSSGTSLATTVGTDYISLPIAAQGYGGQASMMNATTLRNVNAAFIDVATSRCYLPTQSASANTFIFAGWYEI